MFGYGALVAAATPLWLRLSRAAITAVFLFGALQAIERLWRPQAAIERSCGLSDSGRRLIGASGWVARGAGVAGILLTVVFSRDSRADVLIAGLTLIVLGHCFADLAGENGSRRSVDSQARERRV
ncbi:MAG TPA: hypothetical protein VG297_08240 [Bryobacteraceae bacterium]|jgi:hypothetical protein|nr:hypothetical protein [Bryobacteraceae bacterium]